MKIISNFHMFIIAGMLTVSGTCFAQEQENFNENYSDDAISLCEKQADNAENPDMYLQECIDRHLYPEMSTQDAGSQQ
ncbi:MAG: hypothetical protein OQL09_06440 [Gammaproteobacteria bacterium]|nr:hypothetical protein [Gammaproteobacteria bacterium]